MYSNSTLVLPETFSQTAAEAIIWKSPSNIALVKYWGKFGQQLPQNPSISITLNNAHTITSLRYVKKQVASNDISLQFTFEGKKNKLFANKIQRFLASLTHIWPFLTQLDFTIDSKNSFPHSSGIASSASSMSALALCLCSLERKLFGTLQQQSDFLAKASYIARLGSGSASRSVYANLAVWGLSESLPNSSNYFAIPFDQKIHPFFNNYHDDILIVSRSEKKVSSRAGHALMNTNVYAATRYAQARNNLTNLLSVLQSGDAEKFIAIVETEALVLHALMMCSSPSFILMQPNTLTVIEKIRAYREATKVPICFTLDAGPNVHVLYPHEVASQAQAFIKSELLPLCEDNYYIPDMMGQGPLELGSF